MVEVEKSLNSASQAPDRVMTAYEDDIPESARPGIEAKTREIRNEIRDAKDHYRLERDTVSNRRRLSAKLLILGVDLTECRPQYLRSYGEVPDDQARALDERMSRLEAMVDSLIRLLSE